MTHACIHRCNPYKYPYVYATRVRRSYQDYSIAFDGNDITCNGDISSARCRLWRDLELKWRVYAVSSIAMGSGEYSTPHPPPPINVEDTCECQGIIGLSIYEKAKRRFANRRLKTEMIKRQTDAGVEFQSLIAAEPKARLPSDHIGVGEG